MFKQIIERDNWIFEGSPRESLKESFGCCEYIMVLNEKRFIRHVRVFKRWVLQRIAKEKYNSKSTLKFLFYNIK